MRASLPLVGYWLSLLAAGAALYWGAAFAVFLFAGSI